MNHAKKIHDSVLICNDNILLISLYTIMVRQIKKYAMFWKWVL